MILDDKTVVLFKVFVLYSATVVFYKNTETGKLNSYLITNSVNERDTIKYLHVCEKAQNEIVFVGYGCHDFDNHIINYIIKSVEDIRPSDIYYFSKSIEENEELKFDEFFFSFDMKKIYLPEKQRLSFSQLRTQLGCDYNQDNLESILLNNGVDALEILLNLIKDKIQLRLDLFYKYRINALHVDDTLLGIRYMTKMYLLESDDDRQEFISKRTQAELGKIGQLVKTKPKHPKLEEFYDEVKNITVNPLNAGKTAWNTAINLLGIPLSVGQGGVHSITKPSKFVCKKGERIVKYDFTSMYPTIMCNLDLFPRHMKPEFKKVYKDILDKRIQAKMEGNEAMSSLYKKVINSAIGLMNSDWSYMYDPLMSTAIRLNAEFTTLELMCAIPSVIIQVNIDGIFCIENVNKSTSSLVKDFMAERNMPYEEEIYTSIYQISVNDYVAYNKDTDTVVAKGLFANKKESKSYQPSIVTDAIIRNLIHGHPVKKTIDECMSPAKFLITTNVTSAYNVFSGDEQVPNHIRYYYSTKYPFLVRKKDNSTSIVDSTSGAKVIFSMEDMDLSEIDKTPYYGMANKITQQFSQLNLFE